MKVALVTTSWQHHRCGIAEYSRMLVEHTSDPEIQFVPIFGPYDRNSIVNRAGGCDIVHLMYESGYLGDASVPGIAAQLRDRGTKSVMVTLHDHWPRNNRQLFPTWNEFDRIIVHQDTGDGFPFITIPHGIDVLEPSLWSEENITIGLGGFPLPQKNTVMVAEAAAILVKETSRIQGVTMVCPESQHVDTHAIGRQVRAAFPDAQYVTEWLPQHRVQEILSTNLVNVYPMRDGKPGISASVRMGLATGGYMVLSRSSMFDDLFYNVQYHDEIGWIEGPANEVTPRKVTDAVLQVLEARKRPRRILQDMDWKKVAAMHAELYRQLVGQGVPA